MSSFFAETHVAAAIFIVALLRDAARCDDHAQVLLGQAAMSITPADLLGTCRL